MAFEWEKLHHVMVAIPPGGEDCARGGGVEFHLGVEPDFRPARKAHPGILVRDLDGLADTLTAAGRAVDRDPDFPGHRRFYSFDDHGNRLEFLEPVRD